MARRDKPPSRQVDALHGYGVAVRQLQREVEVVAEARSVLLCELRDACMADDHAGVMRLSRRLTGLDDA